MPGVPTGRRDDIRAAALELFTTSGYDATPISAIAHRLGISKAAIAYYFPTKDAFLTEFLTPFVHQLDAATNTPGNTESVLGRYIDAVIDHHQVAVWVDTDPAIQNQPTFASQLDEINERILKTITSGSRRKADRARALALLGGIWRPARSMTTNDLTTHRDEILQAAQASY